MLERALVPRTRGQQEHSELRPVALRGEALDHAPELGEERRDAFDVVVAKQIGQRSPHHQAILERVARAGRGLGAIRVDRESTGRIASDVDRVEVQPLAADGPPPVAGPQEVRVTEDELRRKDPFAKKPLVAVAVGDDRVEQPGALAQPHAKHFPLRALDDERDRVELPRPVRPLGNAEDVEGDFLLGDPAPHRLTQLLEIRRRVRA